MNDFAPPKVLGYLLTLLGIVLIIGGTQLVLMGDNFYFGIIGIGYVISGYLMTQGKLSGAYTYAATLTIVIAWSLIEVGVRNPEFLTRITLPCIIGIYIFANVRHRLN